MVHPHAQGAVVGIDLGTTNSVVATVIGNQVEVIRDRNGTGLVPSAVAFVPTGEVVLGRRAKERALLDPSNTILSSKRIIGRPCSLPETQRIIAQLPYVVTAGENDEPVLQTRAGLCSVTEISTRILAHLRAGAEMRLGQPVTGCVVTVPANFTDGQREATRRAAVGAGMSVLRILNEPTAAAVALGVTGHEQRTIGVFDLGGGTFDFTVLRVHDGLFEVLATGGEPYLGGDDFDNAIADRFAYNFLREHRVDLNAHQASRARLLLAAQNAKLQLSEQGMVDGIIRDIAYGVDGREMDLHYSISRAEFEAVIGQQVDYAINKTQQVLLEANLTPASVDEIALVGGSTLIPLVRRRVARLFGKEPNTIVNPLEAVARGAALHAHGLWLASHGPPTSAVQSGTPGVGLLMDVTSHGVGVATIGDNVQFLIRKNTTIPCEGNHVFSTVRDNQTEVIIRICQGEAPRFSESEVLGILHLTNLRPAPRGDTKIAVEFIMDANGILQVSARDIATGQQTAATLSVVGLGSAPR